MRDAYLQPPSAEMVSRFAVASSIPFETAERTLEKMREKTILGMSEAQGDPYRNGYEPPIWHVAYALMRGYRPTERQERTVRAKTGLGWDEFAERIRARLGFRNPVGEMLLMGANRSGKTDFAAKTVIRLAMQGGKRINVGFQSLPTGKQVQEPRIWHYLPKELKKTVKEREEYISYTKQNGFSSSKITFRNGSDMRFMSYEMKVRDVLEGSDLDEVWLDEEFGYEWLEAARGRVASKGGSVLCTFTPISGYTPVVSNYLEGMQVVRWHTAYMLPRDGGERLPWREVGLGREEYERLRSWRAGRAEGDPGVPESRPEECHRWALEEKGERTEPEVAGRAFERLPRVAVAQGGRTAVVWFYGSDNPYGLPSELIEQQLKNANATEWIKKRVYGVATKIKGRLFPDFSMERNVIRREELPKRLVRIMVLDPAPERNWTSGWYGYEPETDILYKYRDWPGNYEIPGQGVPGPWAVESDRNGGMNDGAKGDAQESFGMGFLAYKYEWARLERWKDFTDWIAAGHEEMAELGPEDFEEIANWSELNGTNEPIRFRVIDGRAAAQSKISAKENVSLFDEVCRLAEGFERASGKRIETGVNLLQDRVKTGRYKVTEDCVNTIFAYRTYTGKDGQKGACKDFVDCDRYAVESGVTQMDASEAEECGGGNVRRRRWQDEDGDDEEGIRAGGF